MILCGWCGKQTGPGRCSTCGHEDPERPYVQRGQEVPQVRLGGRPGSDRKENARRLAEARNALGSNATVEDIAEHLDVSPRTVRRWQEMARS